MTGRLVTFGKPRMRLEHLIMAVVGCAVVAIAWWVGLGSDLGVSVVLVGILFLIFMTAAHWMTGTNDPWFGRLAIVGFAVKIVSAGLRWGLNEYHYGTGDSFAYHAAGARAAEIWRQFQVPELVTGGRRGTVFVENLTGLLYAPYVPHVLGGFFLFASVGFAGQLLFYAAYRRAFPTGRLRAYCILMLFAPTVAFWPSSIGKEAIMIFFLGLSTYAASRLFDAFQLRWLIPAAGGLWGATVIRSHVAVLFGAAMLLALVVGRAKRTGLASGTRKLLVLSVAVLASVVVLSLFANTFGLSDEGEGVLALDFTFDDLDPVIADVERNTGQGGSEIDASAIRSLVEFPTGFMRVMFAPFLWQSNSLLTLLAAVETTAMLALFIWASPALLGIWRGLRRYPMAALSLAYVVGFTFAFSAILNLGILTRQRSQVAPFFFALCLAARDIASARTRPSESKPTPHPAVRAGAR